MTYFAWYSIRAFMSQALEWDLIFKCRRPFKRHSSDSGHVWSEYESTIQFRRAGENHAFFRIVTFKKKWRGKAIQ